MDASVCFKKPDSIKDVKVTTFSDAHINVSKCPWYGQTGLLTGLRFQDNTFLPISWVSVKQKCVCYSAYGAEILAFTDADERFFYVKHAVLHLLVPSSVLRIVVADFTRLHKERDYRLRPTIQRIRNLFDSKEPDALR